MADQSSPGIDGIGKPEPLRHLLAGCWSRRITDEQRLVCLVDGDDLVALQRGSTTSEAGCSRGDDQGDPG